jgi:hypothetical protein
MRHNEVNAISEGGVAGYFGYRFRFLSRGMEGLALLMVAGVLMGSEAWGRIDDLPPPEDLGQTWVELDGEIFGAKPDALGPIGGGRGYQRLVTDGDYRVSTVDELREALGKAKAGEVVFVEQDADMDCTALVFSEGLVLEIPGGVTLAGNRGQDGARGAMIYSDAFKTRPLIRTAGPDVRITGLWIRGPDPKRRIDHHHRAFSSPERSEEKEKRSYYYTLPMSNGIHARHPGLEVDNCELSGWNHGAISVTGCRDVHIHHNYIHHNQLNGLGYGVTHNKAQSLIEYNLFNYNRHSIAATGSPPDAYIARHNVEIQHSLSHCFDMHGGRDRKDGTNIAGDWLKIHNNTFRSPARAIAIRGVPQESAEIHHNWFYHSKADGRVISPWPTGGDTRVVVFNNAYGVEHPAVLDGAQ